MIAKVFSAIPCGYEGSLVTVEGDANRGLPTFNLVGMANKTITEARERVRSALTNSGFVFPDRKITISLAPAELAKDGAHLDLPIAVAILLLARELRQSQVEQKLFVGELSLNGQTKPIRGIINIVETAKRAGFHTIYLPRENLSLAQLVSGIELVGISSLTELFTLLKGIPSTSIVKNTKTPNDPKLTIPPQSAPAQPSTPNPATTPPILLDQIYGQAAAKRALTIAVAGRHNLLFTGPPGTGKTLLARLAASLLPPPSPTEQIEIAKLHSLSSTSPSDFTQRPFRSPHHTASAAAILGGGLKLHPGEISLAHRGVLFLDEFPEYARNVLESLRQPLEDGQITLSRANQHTTYPANFMLIATMNPCPCGYYGDPDHACTCTPAQISAYHKRLSGPILDRIDLVVNVDRIASRNFLLTPSSSSASPTVHSEAQAAIRHAAERQLRRYRADGLFNAHLTSPEITKFIHLTPAAQKFLNAAADRLHLSARSYFKVIKVAQTIADLDADPKTSFNTDSTTDPNASPKANLGTDPPTTPITPTHLSEALSYRIRSPADHPS